MAPTNPKKPSVQIPATLSAEALRREMDMADDADADEAPAGQPPKGPENEVWTFPFTFENTRGETFEGPFTDHILRGRREVRRVEQLAAKLGGGVPYEMLAEDARLMNRVQAHMEISMPAAERPKWARSLDDLDDEVLLALWKKVEEHEVHYFRLRKDQASGANDGT